MNVLIMRKKIFQKCPWQRNRNLLRKTRKHTEKFIHTKHRYGLRFVWCGSEERGLLGSKAYCEAHEEELKKGVLNVNLDMIGCTTGSNCYNPKHKHAPGGGDYNITGFRKMMELIKKENPGKLFSTEDCAENWLDLFDSMIVLFSTSSERMGDSSDYVPAFSATYHGTNALFGSYALPDAIPPWDELWPAEDRFPADAEEDWNALYPCQFFLELARDITWGMQPMICNFQMKHIENPEFAEVYKYILDTAKFYYANIRNTHGLLPIISPSFFH